MFKIGGKVFVDDFKFTCVKDAIDQLKELSSIHSMYDLFLRAVDGKFIVVGWEK